MKVGVFGGAFDPPHVGHLIIAEGMRGALELDRVLFIPYSLGPHRPAGPEAGGQHRLAMVRLAIQGHPGFQADDRELRRGGASYTVDTIRSLTAEFPDDGFYLLMGSDQAVALPGWREAEALLSLAHVAATSRPDLPMGEVPGIPSGRFHPVDLPVIHVSSTQVRTRIAEGLSIRYLVPSAVADYIQEHDLYRPAQ